MNITPNEQKGEESTQEVRGTKRTGAGSRQSGGEGGTSGEGEGTWSEFERISGTSGERADIPGFNTGGIVAQLIGEVEQVLGVAQDQLGEVEEFKSKLEESIERLRQRLAALQALQPESEES